MLSKITKQSLLKHQNNENKLISAVYICFSQKFARILFNMLLKACQAVPVYCCSNISRLFEKKIS